MLALSDVFKFAAKDITLFISRFYVFRKEYMWQKKTKIYRIFYGLVFIIFILNENKILFAFREYKELMKLIIWEYLFRIESFYIDTRIKLQYFWKIGGWQNKKYGI